MLNVANYKHPADPFIFEKRNLSSSELSPNSNSVHFGLSNSPTSSVAIVFTEHLFQAWTSVKATIASLYTGGISLKEV